VVTKCEDCGCTPVERSWEFYFLLWIFELNALADGKPINVLKEADEWVPLKPADVFE